MIIQNKATKHRRHANAQEWAMIKELGFEKYWNVISQEDPIEVTKIELVEFKR